MQKKSNHLNERSNEGSSEEQVAVEPETDAHWAKSSFQVYFDVEELARFAEDPVVRGAAALLDRIARHFHTCFASVAAALCERAGRVTVLDLTCETLEPETVYDAGCSTSDQERDQ